MLPTQAQTHVSGIVLDAETKQPLPAVTVRLSSTLGTNSGSDGRFSLLLPVSQLRDTVRFSRLGYTPLAMRLPPAGQVFTVYLHQQHTLLDSVAVTTAGWTEQKIGITNARALVHFTDGTLTPGKPFEIAQLMRVGTAGAALTSVNLFLATDLPDSIPVAVHLYRLENDRPTTQLVKRPMQQRVALRQGWLRLNLTPYQLFMTQDFVLGLTFLPDAAARDRVPLDIKLGGSAKSFARFAGDSTWRVPPHHYRLYVTARMPAHAVQEMEAENRETPATTTRYSVAAQDTFSLFIQLPKAYAHSPRQRYPVVVLLDGNVYFDQVGDMARHLPRQESCIVVGVGRRTFLQQDSLRQRDYTYPTAVPADSLPLSGGGRQFLTFVEHELLPYLDRTYRTDTTQRTLMGHSLGGYFTLFALVEALRVNRSCFSRYVAASPTLGYADQYLLKELAALPPVSLPYPLQVQLTVGTQELRTTTEGRTTQAVFHTLRTLLASKEQEGIFVEQTLYPGYRHLETAIPTFRTGIRRRQAASGRVNGRVSE